MAKKSAKKSVRKSSRSAVAAKRRKPAKKAVAKKPKRAGGSHVSFGLHGMAKIVSRIHEAGLASELDDALGHDDKFVRVQRKSLARIKAFVASKPQLATLNSEIEDCDCPPGDHYCIYI